MVKLLVEWISHNPIDFLINIGLIICLTYLSSKCGRLTKERDVQRKRIDELEGLLMQYTQSDEQNRSSNIIYS